MSRKVRVRFAPSPTGPLHIGGVRTALYNYCFAKKNNGDFILRIEDTDQGRFVPGAQEYIIEALKWCGISPNEGEGFGNGLFAPYCQSERKDLYRNYADQLVKTGHAYYAFDTAAELEIIRKHSETNKTTFAYNYSMRKQLKNSLTLSEETTQQLLDNNVQFVIRFKTPEDKIILVNDTIRGEVETHTSQMDDKVLFKSDGMPTYHLANVVDDYLMQITHVIRGEEWLPSAPLHVLLYQSFGWTDAMPQFAHLPLLLKPDGNGKLSKRDGDRLGFPVFPLEWTDPQTQEKNSGYREKGYYPEAVINMLSLLGWHAQGDKEIFSLNELIEEFSLQRVTKSGAKFDPDKAKWFNQHYLRLRTPTQLASDFIQFISSDTNRLQLEISTSLHEAILTQNNDVEKFEKIILLAKEKIHFIGEAWEYIAPLFVAPIVYDETVIAKRWNAAAANFFIALNHALVLIDDYTAIEIEKCFKQTAEIQSIKPGEVMQLYRVVLTGKPAGADLMLIAEILGKAETITRINAALLKLIV